jgi:hypothetical protein
MRYSLKIALYTVTSNDVLLSFISNVRLGFCKKLNDESWIELMRIFLV